MTNDLGFASNIGGVLVESGSSFQQKLKGTLSIRMFYVSDYLNGCLLIYLHCVIVSFFFLAGLSPDKTFPQAQFSPYENVDYKWNPAVWYL